VLLHLDCHVANLSASFEISLSHQAVYYYLLNNPVSGPSFVPTVITALHPSNRKDTLKETTHGNLRIIYKMQVKSCRNIFRVYQKQDNFSTELEPRERVMSQTSFGHISTNSSTIPTVLRPA